MLSTGDSGSFNDEFVQIDNVTGQREAFIQGEKFGALDIMLVVDDSGSMSEEQVNLSTKLEALISEVGKADWRIAVTTTSMNRGCVGLVTKQDVNPSLKFAQIFQNEIDTGGDGTEVGFYQAVRGLTMDCQGQSWVRNDSSIAVLIVSDEDNCSSLETANNSNNGQGNSCKDQDWLDSNYLVDHLKTIRTTGPVGTAGVNARIYGIVKEVGDLTCTSADNEGVLYEEAILATGGTTGSICDADYTDTLKAISSNISSTLESQFALRTQPIEDTLVVKIDGQEIPATGYRVTKDGITFVDPPAKGAKVTVEYRAATEALQRTFKLTKGAVNKGVTVYVNDVEVEKGKYYIDEINQLLIFDEEPPAGSAIRFEFDGSNLDRNRFKTELGLPLTDMKVLVDGEQREDFRYDPKTGMIEFETPLRPEQEIEIKYVTNLPKGFR
jgi:hypothetical protein